MPYNYGPYYGPPQGPWVPSQGAPPGYIQSPQGDGPLAGRFGSLGTWSMVLGILDLLYCFYKFVSAALTSSIFALNSSLLGATPTPPPSGLSGAMSAAQDFASKIAIWDAVRTVPFGIASGVLIALAVRFRRGDRQALFAARTWVWCAFGILVFSVILQLAVIVPMTLDYEHRLMASLSTSPLGSKPLIDFGGFMETWTMVSSGIAIIGATAIFAIWPIVLRIWADRLIRDTTPMIVDVNASAPPGP